MVIEKSPVSLTSLEACLKTETPVNPISDPLGATESIVERLPNSITHLVWNLNDFVKQFHDELIIFYNAVETLQHFINKTIDLKKESVTLIEWTADRDIENFKGEKMIFSSKLNCGKKRRS